LVALPKAVLRGLQADMDSSREIHPEQVNSDLGMSLNSSIMPENSYQGSLSFLSLSTKIAGKKLQNSFHL